MSSTIQERAGADAAAGLPGANAGAVADARALAGLRRQWAGVAVVYALAVGLGFVALRQLPGQPLNPQQWLLLAAACAAIQLGILWVALPQNRPPSGGPLFAFLGYANGITLLRGVLECLLAGFLFAPAPLGWLAWAPALLYTLDRLVDFGDGYVARVTRTESKLGSTLDIEFDGLGILIAVGLGILYGKLPPWYLLLGLGRQLFVAGMWLRTRRGLPVYDLPPSEHRRMIAGFQTGFISVMLWPLWTPQLTLPAAWLFALPLIFSFGRDWLVVSGVIDATSPGYWRVRAQAKTWLEGWLPLAARLAAGITAIWLLWRLAPGFAAWQEPAAAQGWAGLLPLLPALLVLWCVAVISVLLGILGRVGALALALLAALDILAVGLNLPDGNALLFVCTVIVVHLGAGKFARWQPEERLLRTRLGAREPANS